MSGHTIDLSLKKLFDEKIVIGMKDRDLFRLMFSNLFTENHTFKEAMSG